nr:tetratricopeptide repeat protein [Ardenticatena sp.]
MTSILDFRQGVAQRLLREGRRYEAQGNVSAAADIYRRAVEMDPDFCPARLALADQYRKLGRFEEALEQCRIAVELMPDAHTHLQLAQILMELGHFAEAESALLHVLRDEPDNTVARFTLAFLYYRRREYAPAITEFYRVAQLAPNWATFFFLGDCYFSQDRFDVAQRVWKTALLYATSADEFDLTRNALQRVRRYLEFSTRDYTDLKAHYYREDGVAYLGTAEDDGVRIPPYISHAFTFRDIATTLRRLIVLSEALGLTFDAVTPVDIASLPLALALSRWWNIRTDPLSTDRVLLVQALGREACSLRMVAEEHATAVTFCLSVSWREPWLPDLIGVVAPLRSSVPWYTPDDPDADAQCQLDRADHLAQTILHEMQTLPPEPSLDAQLAYYTQRHRLLRFLPVPLFQ